MQQQPMAAANDSIITEQPVCSFDTIAWIDDRY